jgi:hypothetical protein
MINLPATMHHIAQGSVPNLTVIDAEPGTLSTAIGALIDSRRRNLRVALSVRCPEPRAWLLPVVLPQLLTDNPSPDTALERYDSFANGQLTLNGAPQAHVEDGLYTDAIRLAFADATKLADVTVFSSLAEAERAARLFGTRSIRSAVFASNDAYVPAPPSHRVPSQPHIAVWTDAVDPAWARLFALCTFDLRTPIRYLDRTSEDAATTLASARSIVALAPYDPRPAIALARFGRPLIVSGACGASEVLRSVERFDPLRRLSIVDAVLRGLGGTPPTIESWAAERERPPSFSPAVVSEAASRVSIIMPTWNRPVALHENLTRLQAQTYPNIEIVVVNCAGDPVESVVAPFTNVRLVNRSVNTGSSTVPRIDGFNASTGTYVAFLDDDDIFFPDHIATMVEVLERNDADVAFSDYILRFIEMQPDGTQRELGWDLEKAEGLTSHEQAVHNKVGYLAVFARRSAYDALRIFGPDGATPEDPRRAYEIEMWPRLLSRFDFVRVDRPTTAYSIRPTHGGTATMNLYASLAEYYEDFWREFTSDGLPRVQARREAALRDLRATVTPPPRFPRYPLLTPTES